MAARNTKHGKQVNSLVATITRMSLSIVREALLARFWSLLNALTELLSSSINNCDFGSGINTDRSIFSFIRQFVDALSIVEFPRNSAVVVLPVISLGNEHSAFD